MVRAVISIDPSRYYNACLLSTFEVHLRASLIIIQIAIRIDYAIQELSVGSLNVDPHESTQEFLNRE